MGRIGQMGWASAARRTIPDRLEPPHVGCYGGNSVCIHCSNILERPFRLARFIGSGVCSNEK